MKCLRVLLALIVLAEALSFPPRSSAKPSAADPPPAPKPVEVNPEVDRGALPPTLEMEGPISARLGEMVVLRANNPSNVDYCEWDIDPQPDSSVAVDVVKKIPNSKQYTLDGPVKRELHWSSTTPGVYTVLLSFSGPGGVSHVKRKVTYGTRIDGNVTAPARENMAMEAEPGFETLIIQQFRRCEDPKKTAHAMLVADALDETAALVDSENITTRLEVVRYLRESAQKHLRIAYADWTPFLRALSQALSDGIDSGEINTVADEAKILRATAEILRGE